MTLKLSYQACTSTGIGRRRLYLHGRARSGCEHEERQSLEEEVEDVVAVVAEGPQQARRREAQAETHRWEPDLPQPATSLEVETKSLAGDALHHDRVVEHVRHWVDVSAVCGRADSGSGEPRGSMERRDN